MLRGGRHVSGLRRNLISLGVLHDGGMEFRCDRDKKTLETMEDELTVMIGERTASHLYRLQGSTIAGGVTETGVAGIAKGSHGGGGLRQTRRVALTKLRRKQLKSGVHGSLTHGQIQGGEKYSPRWSLLSLCRILCIRVGLHRT